MVEWPALPPSSSGLGRGPLKAETGVRVPVGAHYFYRSLRHAILAKIFWLSYSLPYEVSIRRKG
jgi:hypothetical protein